jgi:hypothetical protein
VLAVLSPLTLFKNKMKYLLKLEALALLSFFTFLFFQLFPSDWSLFAWLFFVPDISFAAYVISKKLGAIAYNVFHHQGFLITLCALGYFIDNQVYLQIGLIFLAHSNFDRVAGYGLKYLDNFDHTHLGWIGKSKHLNRD